MTLPTLGGIVDVADSLETRRMAGDYSKRPQGDLIRRGRLPAVLRALVTRLLSSLS